MNSGYSILINSCDAYSDVWESFFFILNRTWKDSLPKIYLNTEKKNFTKYNVITLNNKFGNTHWGKRLINCLERIDDEYVLMMLEDFLFESNINVERIKTALEMMKNDNNLAAIQLIPQGECCDRKYKDMGFVERVKRGRFTIVAGPTLWRKTDLISITKPSDNPWEWEYFGSFRTWFWGKRFLCWCNISNPIFVYDVEHGGAIHRGKWVGYKVQELEKKYGISIISDQRDIVYDWMENDKEKKIVPRIKRIKSIIHNRTKIILEIGYGLRLRFFN